MFKVIFLILGLCASVVWAQNAKKQIEHTKEELQQLRQKQNSFVNQLEQQKQSEWQIGQTLDYLKNNTQQLEIELVQARIQVNKVKAQLRQFNKDLEELDGQVNDAATERQQQLIGLYKLERTKASSWLPTSAIFRDYLRNLAVLEYLTENSIIKLQAFAPLLDERKEQRALLLEKEQKFSELLLQEDGKLSALQKEQQQQQAYLQASRKKQAVQVQNLQEIEQAFVKVRQRLDKLEKNKQSSTKTRNLQTGLSSGGSTQLTLPIQGKLVKSFGNELSTKYTVHQRGVIVQSVKSPHEVRVVKGGKVVFLNRMRGFDNLVIVDHGGSDFSVYGYLGEMYIKKDQQLKQGQALGKLANPRFGEDFVLYFELRFRGKSVDPIPFLDASSWK